MITHRHRALGDSGTQSKGSITCDLFRSTCAPDLARMMIDLVDDDQTVVEHARTTLLESVTTKRDYALAFLKMFTEDQIPGISDIFSAARRFTSR